MKLSPVDKERIKFHLGINNTTATGDVFWADKQLGKNFQAQILSLIKANLDGLDETYSILTSLTQVTRQEVIVGDVNRTITNSDIDATRIRKRYIAQGDLLAESIGIENKRGKDPSPRQGYSEVITQIHVPDGSSVGSRLVMADLWS